MLYRDFMQKYRPLFAPPDAPSPAVGDGAAAEASGGDAGNSAAAAPALETAPAAAAPAVEAVVAPAADAASAAPASEPSLLEAASSAKPDAAAADSAAPKDSPAPADDAATKDAKTAEGEPKPDAGTDAATTDPEKKDVTAEAQPPAPIKYDAFKLPDGIKLDDERLGKFTEVAGNGQVSQDVAQSLLDLHIGEMQRYADEVAKAADQSQRDVWKKLNDAWKADFRKDEKLGGNRSETTLAMAKAVIEEYGGTPDQVRELMAHTTNNGMGNYIGFIRLMTNIGEALNIFEESEIPANPTPPKIPQNRGQKWYGGTMGNGAAKP